RIAPSRPDSVLHKHRVKQICNGAHGLRAHARVRIIFGDLEECFAVARARDCPDSVEPSRDTQSSELLLKIGGAGASTSFDLSLRFDPCMRAVRVQPGCRLALLAFI